MFVASVRKAVKMLWRGRFLQKYGIKTMFLEKKIVSSVDMNDHGCHYSKTYIVYHLTIKIEEHWFPKRIEAIRYHLDLLVFPVKTHLRSPASRAGARRPPAVAHSRMMYNRLSGNSRDEFGAQDLNWGLFAIVMRMYWGDVRANTFLSVHSRCLHFRLGSVIGVEIGK